MANVRTSHKSGFITRNGVRRRESLWFNTPGITQTVATNSTAFLLTSLNAAALGLRPFTVVRTRGLISCITDQNAATEDQHGAYGHAVVSDQATAIGVTAVPTPVTDNGSDLWFVYERFMSDFQFGTAVGFAKIGGYFSIDSRAMRKVEDGQDIISVVESEAAGLTAGFAFRSYFRCLIKLH